MKIVSLFWFDCLVLSNWANKVTNSENHCMRKLNKVSLPRDYFLENEIEKSKCSVGIEKYKVQVIVPPPLLLRSYITSFLLECWVLTEDLSMPRCFSMRLSSICLVVFTAGSPE